MHALLSMPLDARAEGSLLSVDPIAIVALIARLCADVGTLTYHLRLNGDRVDSAQLAVHDDSLRGSLDAIVGGGLTDESRGNS